MVMPTRKTSNNVTCQLGSRARVPFIHYCQLMRLSKGLGQKKIQMGLLKSKDIQINERWFILLVIFFHSLLVVSVTQLVD